jgi:hypothetical protein
MSPIPFADDFLAGSLLTLLLPCGLLVAIAILFVLAVKRVPTDTPTASAALPPPEVVAAASDVPSEINPAGPPPGDTT